MAQTHSSTNKDKDAYFAETTYRNAVRAYWVNVTTLYLLVVNTTATLVLAYWAWRSAEVAQKTLETTECPWIKASLDITVPLTLGSADGQMTVTESLENFGHSPAMEVFSWEDIVPYPLENAFALQKKMCDMRRYRNEDLMSGYILFPTQRIVRSSDIGDPTALLKSAQPINPNERPLRFAFAVVGCVDYRFSFEVPGGRRHETRFMYLLGKPKGGAIQPYVASGVHPELTLNQLPIGNTAD